MKSQTITIDHFETMLGTIRVSISIPSDCIDISVTEQVTHITTSNYSIEVIAFTEIKNWMQHTAFPVEDTKGWIFRITKTADSVEPLNLRCELISDDPNISSSPNSGEHLDAVWIENKTHFLTIGTEDGEMLNARATINDFMPARFTKTLGHDFSFTNYLKLGFETTVPALLKDEKIYFHYLTAIDPVKKSNEYPYEDAISVSLAVDFPKRTLMKRLQLDE